MKRILILAAFLPCVAFAQAPSMDEINGRLAAAEAHQLAVSRMAADREGKMADYIAKLTAQLEAAKKAAEVCKPEEKK